jgi:hypothetical protein
MASKRCDSLPMTILSFKFLKSKKDVAVGYAVNELDEPMLDLDFDSIFGTEISQSCDAISFVIERGAACIAHLSSKCERSMNRNRPNGRCESILCHRK